MNSIQIKISNKFSISILLCFLCNITIAQSLTLLKAENLVFRQMLDAKMKAILNEEDQKDFTGLEYYPISSNYFVRAKLIKSKKQKPFEMLTTTTRRPLVIKYGKLHFTLNGKKYTLSAYQDIKDINDSLYKDDLLIPFKDLTNGKETYGGNRFIELKIPPKGNLINIDFNKAYNPYCAYSHKFSCEMAPEENNLKVEIKAGAKYITKYPIHGVLKEEVSEGKGYTPVIRTKELNIKDIDGTKIDLEKYKGKMLVINFWATWCGPCQKEFPYFEAIKNKYQDKVNFIMVSDEELSKILSFQKENNYSLLLAQNSMKNQKIGLTTLPATYFYSSNLDFLSKNIGALSIGKLESIIKEMIELEKPK